MFVPHEPSCIFDVERHSDRCVCGRSAIITCHDPYDIDDGYCDDCAKKRTDFVKKTIGEVSIDTQNTFFNSICYSYENIRKSILSERLYYMIDAYFGLHQDDEFSEPYDNTYFVEQVYREKSIFMEKFISNIILPKGKLSRKEKIIYDYILKLKAMYEADYEILGELCAKNGGYSYKKVKK